MRATIVLTILLATSVACSSPPPARVPQRSGFLGGGGFSSGGGSTSITALNSGIPGTENGQVLMWNGSAWALNRGCGDPTQRYCGIEEFEAGTNCTTIGKFSGAVTGTGAGCTYNSLFDSGHPGILAIATGSTTTGGGRMSIGSTIAFGGNVGTICSRWLFQLLNVSNATIEYLFRAGFSEPTLNDGTNSVDAVQVVYDRPNTGDKFALQTCSNNSCTLKVCDGTGGTTNAPVSAATWTTAELCVNGAGTSATLKINGTLCATQTATIPTGTSRTTSVGLQCHNRTGSVPASQICYVDYAWWSLPFGTAR